MSILDWISGLFEPVAKVVDNVHTSEEEKLELRNALAEIESKVTIKKVELDKEVAHLTAKLAESASKVAVAESQSDNLFTKTYRPAIVTGMFIMISLNSFGLLQIPLPDIFIQVFGASFGIVAIGRDVYKTKRIGK